VLPGEIRATPSLARTALPSYVVGWLRAAGASSHDRDVEPEESESAVYAVVRAGSKQQKVAVGDVIEIDKIETGVGETLTLPVVMVVDGEKVTATGLEKAGVTVEVLGATKGPKIVIQKYKNKTGYKKRQGHRQKYTQVKVTDISA
jgi:large subunit ribosomal protein L21